MTQSDGEAYPTIDSIVERFSVLEKASRQLQQAFRDAGEGKNRKALVAASEVMAMLHGTAINIIDPKALDSTKESGVPISALGHQMAADYAPDLTKLCLSLISSLGDAWEPEVPKFMGG